MGLEALLVYSLGLSADHRVFPFPFLDFLTNLCNLQPSSFLLHLPDLSEALLLLEFDLYLSCLIFFFVLKAKELLRAEFGFLEGLGFEFELILEMLSLYAQLIYISIGELKPFLVVGGAHVLYY